MTTRRRRLTARSVVASTLLGVSPPELPTRALVGTAELLGIAPGTARVAMSRMVAAGELEANGHGYRLVSPGLLARQARQDLSRRGPDPAWDGTWRTALVTADDRTAADRANLRSALATLRYGELREGVWLRPTNLPTGVLADAEAVAARQCTFLSGHLDAGTGEPELAAGLWALDGWRRRADELLDDLAPLAARLAGHDHTALAEGFVVSADVLRHLQADPLLPRGLLPAGWPGDELRAVHRTYDADFKATLTAWQRANHPGHAG